MGNSSNDTSRYARCAEIVLQEDASGWQVFSYGKLGEVTENIRTFALPFESKPYTFKMCFEYDSWNRMQRMTYPDGEKVSYGYNLGGMLKSISGTKMNNAYPYIDSIRYNEFELKEAVYYGNGTKTFYKYDILQRLINLQSYTATTATPSELMQNIDYTYDAVSNITDIDNSAGILANGLGGKYHDRHTYDNLYRLVYSKGNWLGSPNTNYELEMSYNLNGRIGRKTLTAGIVTQTPMTNSFNSVGYDNSYHYANTSQPNTLTYIDNNGPQQFFKWDAKGNMTYHKNTAVSLERFLCWDEQNRLQGVRDKSSLSVYQYDANGDRTYKLTGDYTYQNVSGTWRYFYQLDNATLYASPYLVVTPKGYTKHYYAESERIASKLGNGRLQELGHPLADDIQVHDKLFANKNHAQSVIYECLNAEEVRAFSPLSYLYELTSASQSPENERYFYHPDHLGSSSWITFTDGEAVQHLHYLPFGEDFVNQQHTVVGAMYTFSAKEKDTETGYSYFGSRYYSSDLSIWLSVDPMAAKYPSLSPYVYCANNPVKLVDPNGEDYVIAKDDEKKTITIRAVYYTKKENKESVQEGINYWNNQSGNFSLEQDGEKYTINFELTLAEGNFTTDEEARSAASLGNGKANNYVEINNPFDQKGATTSGNTIQLHPQKATHRTLHHEIGHTLGMFHTPFDNNVMYGGGESDVVIKRNVRQCIKGYYSNHTYIGGSTTHIGKCKNYIIGDYHGKIIQNK